MAHNAQSTMTENTREPNIRIQYTYMIILHRVYQAECRALGPVYVFRSG